MGGDWLLTTQGILVWGPGNLIVHFQAEALPDLDDLLQCPVCYEIPTGQIFQCNEGHHVCGRCKMRLDVCPVCRALFFGTRNYAMEELIANVRKLRAFKLGGKVTTGSSSESNTPAVEESTSEPENVSEQDDENNLNFATRPSFRAPQACKGLFRCLCCKNGNSERLPAGRLLNHLRYYHSPELIEGQSDNGEYLQAWQFSTAPGRIVTAVRVADMGIFYLIIEINTDTVCAWLTMAASPWVAHEFCYTVTISGNDREAIFSDCVWSVRACEGSLKKRGHCLVVNGLDARALTAPAAISGKLSLRRVPPDQLTQQSQPRAVLRVATRGTTRDSAAAPVAHDLEPFLQDLQNDVARLSRAFATLGMEANALVRSEAEMRARIENGSRNSQPNADPDRAPLPASQIVVPPLAANDNTDRGHMSRSARRRMRQRLRAALNETRSSEQSQPSAPANVSNGTRTTLENPPRTAPEHPPGTAPPQPLQAAHVQPPRAVNIQPTHAAAIQPPRSVNVQPPRAAPLQPPLAVNVQQPLVPSVQPLRAAPIQQPWSNAQSTATRRRSGANEDVPVFRVGLITVHPASPVAHPPAPTQSSSGSQSSGASQDNSVQTRTSKKKRRQRKHN